MGWKVPKGMGVECNKNDFNNESVTLLILCAYSASR